VLALLSTLELEEAVKHPAGKGEKVSIGRRTLAVRGYALLAAAKTWRTNKRAGRYVAVFSLALSSGKPSEAYACEGLFLHEVHNIIAICALHVCVTKFTQLTYIA